MFHFFIFYQSSSTW